MAASSPTSEDRERYTRARESGEREARDPSAVTAARYERGRDAIALEFASGAIMRIPRGLISELDGAAAVNLESVTVSPAGDALSWRALDVDLYVPGLVERAFGTRVFAASYGRRGGKRTSRAKRIAAKANGAKGGRPRKEHTA